MPDCHLLFMGGLARKNPIQASDFRASTADRLRASSVDCNPARQQNQRDEFREDARRGSEPGPLNGREKVQASGARTKRDW